MDAAQDGSNSNRSAGLLDVLVVLAENGRLIALGTLTAALLGFLAALALPATYTATTRVLPPQQQQNVAAMLAGQFGALSGLATAAGVTIKNPADTYVALIKSRTIADVLIGRFELDKYFSRQVSDDTRKELAKVTRILPGKDGLITIDVEVRDPKLAAKLANAYVEEVGNLSGKLAITEAQQRRVFFEKQMRQAHEDLKVAEVALTRVGVGESLIKAAPQAVLEAIARLRAQITAQEIRISTMKGFLTETSPEFQLAQRELASLRSQLTSAERDQPMGGQRGEYLNRFRDFKYHETLLELLAKQYELARLDEAREGAFLQIVDLAIPPERRSSPNVTAITAIAASAGALLIVLFVFFRESFRRARQDVDSSGKLDRIRSGIRNLFISGVQK